MPGWSVLGLCCHLVGDDLGLLARHGDGYYGTQGPGCAPEAAFVAWLDELQAEWFRAASRLIPPSSPTCWGGPGPRSPGRSAARTRGALRLSVLGRAGPVPAWLDQARELSEYWIHRQQILQALGRPATCMPTWPAGAGRVALGLPYRLAQPPGQPGDTVTIAITGSVNRRWHLVAGEAGWDYRSQPGPRVIASLTMTTGLAAADRQPVSRRAKRLAATGNNTITGILCEPGR